MSGTPAVLAVDPAKATGLAMLSPDGALWCHTLRLRKVPPDARELAAALAWLTPQMPWGLADEWHLVVERMFGGGNANTSIICAQTAGQLYEEFARMREFRSEAFPYASQWRPILQAEGRMDRERAKATALAFVRRTWPDAKDAMTRKPVDDNAAEACCMALWRQREIEHAAQDMRLGIELPRKGKPRKQAGAKRGRATEAEVLQLIGKTEEDGK